MSKDFGLTDDDKRELRDEGILHLHLFNLDKKKEYLRGASIGAGMAWGLPALASIAGRGPRSRMAIGAACLFGYGITVTMNSRNFGIVSQISPRLWQIGEFGSLEATCLVCVRRGGTNMEVAEVVTDDTFNRLELRSESQDGISPATNDVFARFRAKVARKEGVSEFIPTTTDKWDAESKDD